MGGQHIIVQDYKNNEKEIKLLTLDQLELVTKL